MATTPTSLPSDDPSLQMFLESLLACCDEVVKIEEEYQRSESMFYPKRAVATMAKLKCQVKQVRNAMKP